MVVEKENINGVGSERRKIRVCKNGPYVLSGRIPLIEMTIIPDAEGDPNEWRMGRQYPLKEYCGLCRCGQSKNKPYCDQTHTRINFNGTETASVERYVDQAEEIDDHAIKLTDAEGLCASARFCHRAGGIWDLMPRSDNPNVRKIIIEEAGDCPSGRLVVWDKKTGKDIEPVFEQSIGLVEDPQVGVSGPIWVRGGIQIESDEGKIYEIRNRVTLCRCGKSVNKPFCDSSHYPE